MDSAEIDLTYKDEKYIPALTLSEWAAAVAAAVATEVLVSRGR